LNTTDLYNLRSWANVIK